MATFVVAPWVLTPTPSTGRTALLVLCSLVWGVCLGMPVVILQSIFLDWTPCFSQPWAGFSFPRIAFPFHDRTFTAPKAWFCTIIPGAREAEFMGIQKLFGKSLSWLPPLIYTLINEGMGGDMQMAMFSLSFFFALAAAIFATVDDAKAVAQVKPSLLSRTYSATKIHPAENIVSAAEEKSAADVPCDTDQEKK